MCEWKMCKELFNIDGCGKWLMVVTAIGDEVDESDLEYLGTFISDTELHGCEAAVFDFECEDLYGKLWGFGWIRVREDDVYKRIRLNDAQNRVKKVANNSLVNEEKVFTDRRGQEKEKELG